MTRNGLAALGALLSMVWIGSNSAALAAAGTTCICRTADGKGFEETTKRHSRWGCDVALGYLKHDTDNLAKDPARLRPTTQTCNKEEIHQYKVWICMRDGCTYGYVRSSAKENLGLKKIETLRGERRP